MTLTVAWTNVTGQNRPFDTLEQQIVPIIRRLSAQTPVLMGWHCSCFLMRMITQTYQSQMLGITQTDLQSRSVNAFQRLFRSRGKQHDLSLVKQRVVSSSDREDMVVITGDKTTTGKSMINLTQAHIAKNKCKCGIEWTRQAFFSEYPYACQHCRCAHCGTEKKFIFIFSEE